MHRLVEELQITTLLYLLHRHRAGAVAVGYVKPQRLVHAHVYVLAFALFLGGGTIEVKPTPILTPLAAVFHQSRHRGWRRHAPTKRLHHNGAHVRRHINAHLIDQRHRSHRPAKAHHRLIDLLHRAPLRQQVTRLIHVGA